MDIFINHEEQRPRAGWRILLQFVLFLLFLLIVIMAKNAFLSSSLTFYQAAAMGIAGTASVWISAILLDKRPFFEYGLGWSRPWLKELWIGLGIGSTAMTVIFLAEWAAGWLTITGFGWTRSSLLPYYLWISSYFAATIIIGFYEELIFRGYHILNMIEGFHSSRVPPEMAALLAVMVSSTIFGLLHAGNPNADFISTLNIIFAGFILAIPYLLTGRLAMSIGIHIAWNFLQGGLYGFAVSGSRFRGSLIQINQTGNDYITGGSFGPEAGLLGIGGMLLMGGLLWIYASKEKHSFSLHPFFTNAFSKSVKTDERR